MQFKIKKNQEGIILMISSFNQLYNFLSFFLENKLLKKNSKIYLTIFSDFIPDNLIFEFKQYIEKFANVELVYLKRNSFKYRIKFFNFFYYFHILKKIFQLKKHLSIPYMFVYGKIQYPILLFMFFFSSSKIFLLEDGLGEYVPYGKNEKKLINFLLKLFFTINKSRIRILQLAQAKKDYKRTLNLPFLNNEYYLNNRDIYKNFIKNNFEEKLLFKPKCMILGIPPFSHENDYFKNLYIKILMKIKKKYSYNSEQILFFPHPRTDSLFYRVLVNSLSEYSNIHPINSTTAEHYFSQKNLEMIIGSFSSALYYAKSIYNKNFLYYVDNELAINKNQEIYNNYLNVLKNIGVKNFFD